MKKLLLVVLIALTMTSCATIISGTKKRVTFDGSITKPATMIVDGRMYKDVKLPYRVKVKRGFKDTEVRFIVEGYEPVTVYVGKNFNPWTLLNFAEIFGWVVDVASGAITQPARTHYWVDFTPKVNTATSPIP